MHVCRWPQTHAIQRFWISRSAYFVLLRKSAPGAFGYTTAGDDTLGSRFCNSQSRQESACFDQPIVDGSSCPWQRLRESVRYGEGGRPHSHRTLSVLALGPRPLFGCLLSSVDHRASAAWIQVGRPLGRPRSSNHVTCPYRAAHTDAAHFTHALQHSLPYFAGPNERHEPRHGYCPA